MKLPSFKPIKVLNRQEERKLLLRSSRGDKEARDFLIENNQFLVLRVANSYYRNACVGISFEDMIQEGNIGLITAVDKFDVKNKVRLSTYACHWINKKIEGVLKDKSRLVHIPVGVQYKFYEITKKLKNNPNAKISKRDLRSVKGLGFKIDQNSALTYSSQPLDNPAIFKKYKQHLNIDLERWVEKNDVVAYLNRAIGLTDIQRKIVEMRIGVYAESKNFPEIGREFGISSANARGYFKRGIKAIKYSIGSKLMEKTI